MSTLPVEEMMAPPVTLAADSDAAARTGPGRETTANILKLNPGNAATNLKAGYDSPNQSTLPTKTHAPEMPLRLEMLLRLEMPLRL